MSGLSETSVEVDRTQSGLLQHHQVQVAATAGPTADVAALIDDLAQLGWSVDQHEPDTGVFVRVRVRASPQPVIGEIAEQHGWDDAAYSTGSERLAQLVLLPERSLQDRFGRWPGPVPSLNAEPSPSGGQSLARARDELRAHPSLTDVALTVNETTSGVQAHRRIWLEATTGATAPDDQRDLVEYLLALGWSVGDVDADEGVSVWLHTTPQVVVGDLLGPSWNGIEYRAAPDDFNELVVVPRTALERALGPGPGPPPTAG